MHASRFLLAALALGLAWLTPLTATTVQPPTFSEIVTGSDYIVRAKVKAVTSEARLRQGRERIYTNVELEVLEVIAGSPPSPLVLTMLGGKVGDREMTVSGAPKFTVGSEDILFVKGNGRSLSPLYAMMHGQYPVLHDTAKKRTYVCRSNLVPLLSTDEIAQPLAAGKPAEMLRRLVDPSQALTPADFIRSIRSVRTAKSSPNERLR
jgi:hypothetical protein